MGKAGALLTDQAAPYWLMAAWPPKAVPAAPSGSPLLPATFSRPRCFLLPPLYTRRLSPAPRMRTDWIMAEPATFCGDTAEA